MALPPRFSWEESLCYRIIRDNVERGTMMRSMADIEPIVEVDAVVGQPTSELPPDVRLGWGKRVIFSELPQYNDAPGTRKSNDMRDQNAIERARYERRAKASARADHRSRSTRSSWASGGYGAAASSFEGQPSQPDAGTVAAGPPPFQTVGSPWNAPGAPP